MASDCEKQSAIRGSWTSGGALQTPYTLGFGFSTPRRFVCAMRQHTKCSALPLRTGSISKAHHPNGHPGQAEPRHLQALSLSNKRMVWQMEGSTEGASLELAEVAGLVSVLVEGGSDGLCFSVPTSDRPIVFQAKSTADAARWAKHINQAVDKVHLMVRKRSMGYAVKSPRSQSRVSVSSTSSPPKNDLAFFADSQTRRATH